MVETRLDRANTSPRPWQRIRRAAFAPFLLACLLHPNAAAEPGGLWKGLDPGSYGVGFRFEPTIDPTRNVDSKRAGTLLGLALWYPATPGTASPGAVTQLDYRLLEYSAPLSDSAKRHYVDEQAAMMVAWRHVGIGPLTLDQARATFAATGYALRNAAPAPGKFPVVIILGGPWYLSTTAEFLASHGYLVVACVRFHDERTEIPSTDFRWSIENSLRDAEWALSELRRNPAADTRSITALGHGGGGLQAMLLGMRDRQVTAVANIDSANFSTRTNPAQLVPYSPRLLAIPYCDVQSMLLQFLDANRRAASGPFTQWLTRLGSEASYHVTVREAVEPAPVLQDVLTAIEDWPPQRLREAYKRDAEAEVFSEDCLMQILTAAGEHNPQQAVQLVPFATGINAKSIQVLRLASAVEESAGDASAARELTARCLAIEIQNDDWRAQSAHEDCRTRAGRLRP